MFLAMPCAFAGVEKLKRAEFELHVGPAFPLGNFGKKAFSGYSGGGDAYRLQYHGARVGVSYGLAFQYYAHSRWGVLIMFNGHSNKVKANPFSTYLPKSSWETSSKGKWSEFMAMAGLTFRCSLLDRLVFSARAYMGYAHLVAPFYSSELQRNKSTYTYRLKSSSDANFGYGAGVGLKFLVSRGFHLDLRCDYMGAVPFYFRRVKSTVLMENPALSAQEPMEVESSRNTFHENFNMLNLVFGFTVAF